MLNRWRNPRPSRPPPTHWDHSVEGPSGPWAGACLWCIGVETNGILAGKRILLVDDESLFLSSLREGLEALEPSLTVFEAGDGVAALAVLDAHSVDVVVSDLRMPRLDGVGLLAEMVSRSINVPVVVLSAFRDARNTAKATGMGAVSFLDKPVDYDELIGAIERALQPRDRAFMEGFSLPSLLQMMNFDRKSSTLSVRSADAAGRIFMSEGEVVDAWFGDEFGRKAFGEIMRMPTPTLELAALPDLVQRSITEPLSALLLNAFREDDERRRSERVDGGWDETVDGGWDELVDELDSKEAEDPRDTPQTEPESEQKEDINMANVEQSLKNAMQITGAIGAALVDYESGMTLGAKGGGSLNLEVAAAGNTDVVRAKMGVMNDLGIEGGIKDILITLDAQYHLIRPLKGTTLFMYLAIDSKNGNLAMARHKLASIESELKI